MTRIAWAGVVSIVDHSCIRQDSHDPVASELAPRHHQRVRDHVVPWAGCSACWTAQRPCVLLTFFPEPYDPSSAGDLVA